MKTLFGGIMLIVVFGCFNTKSKNVEERPENIISDSSLLDRKKIQLMETVLNLPSVLKFSKFEINKREYDSICILVAKGDFNGSLPSINQNGYPLTVLSELGSIDTREQPVYQFLQMKINIDIAYVQMVLDNTGLLAYGNLYYIDNAWKPAPEFRVSLR